MAKRFTDSFKWEDGWFRKLPVKLKLLWCYILDRCDNSGVWKIDLELASFFIGDTITHEDLTNFSDRIEFLNNEKIWIIRFIEFQYGTLSRDCKPHKVVFELLNKHKISLSEVPQADHIGKTHNVSDNQRNRIFERDNYVCTYCERKFKKAELVIDHIIPRKKGGIDKENNLITSCKQCNNNKGDLDLFDFIKKQNLDYRVFKRVFKRVSYTLQDKDKDKDKDIKKGMSEEDFKGLMKKIGRKK